MAEINIWNEKTWSFQSIIRTCGHYISKNHQNMSLPRKVGRQKNHPRKILWRRMRMAHRSLFRKVAVLGEKNKQTKNPCLNGFFLVYRALMICSPFRFDSHPPKKKNIYNIYGDNKCPENVIERKIKSSKAPVVHGPALCPIYLELPWLGRKIRMLADRVSACVTSGFSAVKLRVASGTNPIYPSFFKDGSSYPQSICIVYKFKCLFETDYIGPTKWRLETGIGQYVSVNIRQSTYHGCIRDTRSVHDSAISRTCRIMQIVQQNAGTIRSHFCAELGLLSICVY